MSTVATAPRSHSLNLGALVDALQGRVDGDIRFDAGTRAAYSTDSSNYRQVPIGVVIPRTVDAAAEAVAVCCDFDVPVLGRGGGTSLAGECTNVAVVLDFSRYLTGVLSVDVENRRAIVEPGIVLDQLNAELASTGLMFGPKPATHSHCTLGGMIGNNSCGSTAQAFGKTVDSIVRLEVVTYDGTRLWVGATSEDEYERIRGAGGRPAELYRGLRALADEYGTDIREGFPDIPRRVSGYDLDSLLPENGFHVARALAGSESTLVTVLRAELALVPIPAATAFAVLGYPDIAAAADAAPLAARHEPLTVEGMNATLIREEKAEGRTAHALGLLPDGNAYLVVQMPGDDADDAHARLQQMLDKLTAQDPKPSVAVLDDPADQDGVLAVREAALGASAWRDDHSSAWPGWEDAAVPPERLGAYLRDFEALLDRYEYRRVALYGHFGQGCVHCRIPFDFQSPEGIETFSRFVHDAARLVVSYGGSLSGEHGDGQARGALLPIMYGERVMTAFRSMKDLFDPRNRMNPGKVVPAAAVTDDLRMTVPRGHPSTKTDVDLHFSYPTEGGTFRLAADRCVGAGNCRSHSGGVMCPSYRATGDESHSTRGRSRLLHEMMTGPARGGPIEDGWRSKEVLEALDLCLSCKGCKHDCPVDVDMATYKAEFLSHHYAGRLRPAAHYSMGWLPALARVVHVAPRLVNAATHAPGLRRVVARLGGLTPDRPLPLFAPQRFTDWFADRPSGGPAPRGDIMIWPDSFTNNLHPAVGIAAVRVLEDAGYRVVLPDSNLCCGLTWISTGQLGAAEKILGHTLHELTRQLGEDMLMVGLEPSCTATFRSDAPELLAGNEDAALVADRTRTLAEVLTATEGWEPPRIDRDAVVQPHCHQHAIMGFDPDRDILERAGIDATIIDGCCGLAGNFGFENGHLDVSVACAEQELLPALRAADRRTVVLADGFSCRTQVEQTSGDRQAVHLAELLAAALDGEVGGALPEGTIARRVGRPQRIARRVLDRIPRPFAS